MALSKEDIITAVNIQRSQSLLILFAQAQLLS